MGFERGVGILLDAFSEPIQAALIEGGGGPAAMGPGLERAGLASELEPAGDGRDVDAEPDGEFPSGALAIVDGVEDAFAEIVRQGLPESPPLEDLTFKSCATRM